MEFGIIEIPTETKKRHAKPYTVGCRKSELTVTGDFVTPSSITNKNNNPTKISNVAVANLIRNAFTNSYL